MVIQLLKDVLGANMVQAIKEKLGPQRAEALKGIVEGVEGLATGEYKSPSKQVVVLEKRLASRAKDFKKLQQKLWQNQEELRSVEEKINRLTRDLYKVDYNAEDDDDKFPTFKFEV